MHANFCLSSWSVSRAYPGSELVVANTLAKWKKLEPNDINLSQGFSQKVVSTSCFVFNSLPARGDFCCLLITFANSLDPDQARQMSSLAGKEFNTNQLVYYFLAKTLAKVNFTWLQLFPFGKSVGYNKF